jgi:superfamily II DNA/RNA helicase
VSFASLGIDADIVDALSARGITEPFPVQAATIPDALAGRDLCAKAPTGSGKTLAFGIPMVARVKRAAPKQPHALVLAPTRELAAQIQKDLNPIAEKRGLRIFTVYGGVGYEPQKKAMRRGVDILVACPGRLKDLIDQHVVRLDKVEIVVIDEADRMADMGFLPEVRRLLDMTSPKRQTLLFSATLDGDVAQLTKHYQHDPAHHEVEGVNDEPADLDHQFVDLDQNERVAEAVSVIRKHGPTILFCRTRHGAEKVAKQLRAAGVDAAAIHGGLSQNQRDRALAGFKRYDVEALVATDVAARGIHVDGVCCVVHFDPPTDAKTYVHRSGRTARAGAKGTVVSFVTHDQRKAARILQQDLGLIAKPVQVSKPSTDGARRRNGSSGSNGSGGGNGRQGRQRNRTSGSRSSLAKPSVNSSATKAARS